MRLLSARKIAQAPIEKAWESLTGKFRLQFDDGQEIVTNYKETIYSRYFWEFHNTNPGTPLLKEHHLQNILKGERAGMPTHLNFINEVLWFTYDYNVAKFIDQPNGPQMALAYRYSLAEKAYEVTNRLYNDAVLNLGEYVTGMDAFDMLEVFDSKPIQECYDEAQPNEAWIDEMNATIDKFLRQDPSIRQNPQSKLYRSNLINKQQVHQTYGVRGYVDAIDNMRFRFPIMRGYFQGIRTAHDYIVEPQTASMSLNSSKGPLQETEYFSRKLQLLCMVVERIHFSDCGSTRFMSVTIRPKTKNFKGDLCEMLGKIYQDTDGTLKTITAGDTHLEGKTVRVRSVLFCQHPDPRGVCACCYGKLSEQIPYGSNFGHINCVHMTEQSGQAVLSTKHSAKSSTIEAVVINEENVRYLKAGSDGNSFMFSDQIKFRAKSGGVFLRIPIDGAKNLTDINRVDSIRSMATTCFSELDRIVITENDIDVVLAVNQKKRKSSITHSMLTYIKQKYPNGQIPVAEDNNAFYEIDITDYDFSRPFLELPLRNFSMADHAKEIADILESSMSEAIERDQFTEPSSVMVDLFRLVNSKLSVNFAVLEVCLYSAMIRSAESYDYGLVKPHTNSGLGVLKNTLMFRSASAFIAYERHTELFYAPESYVLTNRPDHPFDAVLLPEEVAQFGYRKR